jgi:hypothetical protein
MDFGKAECPELEESVLIPPEDVANTVWYLLLPSDRPMVDQVYIRRITSCPFNGVARAVE